jgi:HAMP domain-containing protein
MLQVREEDIDRITEVFAQILQGEQPRAISLPEDVPDNEIRQAVGYINAFIAAYRETADLSYQLARGEIASDPPKGRTVILQSLKSLHASLRTLTWTTQQIAKGDFSQKISFLGEFSEAFNSMTQQLQQSFEERALAAEKLQTQVDELARTRRAMLNILEDLKITHSMKAGAATSESPGFQALRP